MNAAEAVILVLLFDCSVMMGDSSLAPKLMLANDHYDFGLQIAQSYKSNIMDAFGNDTFYNKKLLPYNKTAEGSETYSKFLASANATFPQYIDELRGMADGLGLTFSELFLWNIKEDMELILGPQDVTPSCSDLYLVNGKTQTLMAHNEDGNRIDSSTSYVLVVQVGSTNESFLALCYAGELCGNAFGYGLSTRTALTNNALIPKNISTSGVAQNFISRALITSNYTEIQRILKEVPCATGFSVNVGSVDSLNISNFEVDSLGTVETAIHNFDYHFNLYIHSNFSQGDDPSSTHRLARVKQLGPASNSTQMLRILGDTTDQQYPIYRTGNSPSDPYVTIATALFDLSGKMFYMYKGNPSTTSPVMSMTLNTGFKELYRKWS